MNVGQALKEIRRRENLTQKEMAANIISPSFYAKVEKGYHHISADDLFDILKAHQLSLEDFIALVQMDEQENLIITFQYALANALTHSKVEEINQLLKDIQATDNLSLDAKQLLQAIGERNLYWITHDLQHFSEDSRQFISNKIFSYPDWDAKKLSIYGNFIDIYDVQTNLMFLKQILKKPFANFTKKEQFIVLAICVNFLVTEIAREKYEEALEIVEHVALFETTQDNFFIKYINEFLRQMILYLLTEDVQYFEAMQEIYRQSERLNYPLTSLLKRVSPNIDYLLQKLQNKKSSTS
ncbi:helix-turn-helix domain-containing protein [Allofustis seminis]|uniref:helix-turn-helix domain-containing protein n=1 Tax=Allofustis seminis TaxID=166939 RepID=UPI000369DDB4|nr:Rgg/GadR/MutR family transcriptional regulator [Allofustis seminis]